MEVSPTAFFGPWAEYWAQFEDRHLCPAALDDLLGSIEGPVLVVGAGQGIVVEHLQRRNMTVAGVDCAPEMIAAAKQRRGLEIVHADARHLPFPARSFRTVIVASGVVDYLFDEGDAADILRECARVAQRGGQLLISFFDIPAAARTTLRRIGLVDEAAGIYYLRRVAEFNEKRRCGPHVAMGLISRYAGVNILRAFARFTVVGLTLPRCLREDGRRFSAVLAQMAEDGRDPQALSALLPERLPLRGEAEIRSLLLASGLALDELSERDGLRLARCRPGRFTRLGLRLSAPQGEIVLEARGLVKRYRGSSRVAVSGLDLDIPWGAVYGILGPNGAGKTTTLSMLCGLLRPDRGTVRLAPQLEARGKRQSLGYVPQDLALYPKLSAGDNIAFFGRLYGLSGKDLARRQADLLDMVGLSDRAGDLVASFSTGMMRRLNLAIGLIHNPQLILLDEPTVGIDPQSRHCIFEAIEALQQKGVTLLYTTHYMEEASRLCARLAIIDHGRLVLEGTPRELLSQYGLYHITLTGGDERTSSVLLHLRGLEGVAETVCQGNFVSVRAEAPDGPFRLVERLLATARTAGQSLELRRVEEPNLESLFLDITGRALRDAGEANLARPRK
jgi:ABC-2 type transport system ATP-binding protein